MPLSSKNTFERMLEIQEVRDPDIPLSHIVRSRKELKAKVQRDLDPVRLHENHYGPRLLHDKSEKRFLPKMTQKTRDEMRLFFEGVAGAYLCSMRENNIFDGSTVRILDLSCRTGWMIKRLMELCDESEKATIEYHGLIPNAGFVLWDYQTGLQSMRFDMSNDTYLDHLKTSDVVLSTLSLHREENPQSVLDQIEKKAGKLALVLDTVRPEMRQIYWTIRENVKGLSGRMFAERVESLLSSLSHMEMQSLAEGNGWQYQNTSLTLDCGMVTKLFDQPEDVATTENQVAVQQSSASLVAHDDQPLHPSHDI